MRGIRFANVKNLKDALDQITPDKQNLEDMTAASCVLIEQLAFDLTSLTSIEPGRATFRVVIQHREANSGGEVGQRFLVDFASLKQKVNSMKKSRAESINFEMWRGCLKLKKNLRVVNGKAVNDGSLSCRLYPGSHDDFRPTTESGQVVATIESEKAAIWIRIIDEFAAFKQEQLEGTVASHSVVITVNSNGLITALTHNSSSYGTFIKMDVLGTVALQNFKEQNEDFEDEESWDDEEDEEESYQSPSSDSSSTALESLRFCIEGKYLKRIAKLTTSDVSIIKNANWITFKSDAGAMTIRTVEAATMTLRNERLFMPNDSREDVGHRVCSSELLFDAIELQSSSEGGQDLGLLEHEGSLIVLPAQNITSDDQGLVTINPLYIQGRWNDFGVSSLGLVACVKAMRLLGLRARLEGSELKLTQRYLIRPSGDKMGVLYIQHMLSQDAECLIFCKALERVIESED